MKLLRIKGKELKQGTWWYIHTSGITFRDSGWGEEVYTTPLPPTHTYQNIISIVFSVNFWEVFLWLSSLMVGMWECFQGSPWKVRTVRPRSTEHNYITFSLWREMVRACSLCSSSLSKFISAWEMNLYKVTLQSGFPQHSCLNVN